MKKKLAELKVPHTYVIILSIMILAAIMTYVIPAGEYNRYENSQGATVVDPASYHLVEPVRTTIWDVLNAAPTGMVKAASLIFFVFITGGAFEVINSTGAIDSSLGRLVSRLSGKEFLIIPIFLFTFSLGGAIMGMSNEVLAFVPIGIAVARKSGFDAAVGTAIVTLGAAAGFSSGTMNPWNVGIAQGLAELPIYSGAPLRIALHIVFLIITSVFLIRYGKRVKADPSKSVVYELEQEEKGSISITESQKPTIRQYLVLISFALGLMWIVWGVTTSSWGTDQMQPVFIAITVVCGLIGGLSPSSIAKSFVNGAKALAMGALVIGIARGILIILQNGLILDTMVYGFASVLTNLPGFIAPLGMYVTHSLLNFFIPSGSAQASATMPLFIPLADVVGMTRQTAVLTFQLGDGITNSINPTSSNTNAYLSLSKISFSQWVRFAGPILLAWYAAGAIFIVIANVIGYGPF